HAILTSGCGRARDALRLHLAFERREEVDRYAVRVTDLRVALAPERVPGLLLGVEVRILHARVQLVDLRGTTAVECERELVACLACPVRAEAADDLLGVEHQTRPARERGLEVTVADLGKVDSEQAVERNRASGIGGHDPDGVQIGHAGTLAFRLRGLGFGRRVRGPETLTPAGVEQRPAELPFRLRVRRAAGFGHEDGARLAGDDLGEPAGNVARRL